MNSARMALQLTGMVFILIGAAVLYYQTDLRDQIPEGYAIAGLLVLAGLMVIVFSEQVRRSRRISTVDSYASTPVRQRTYVHDDDAPRRRSRVREEHVTEERIER